MESSRESTIEKIKLQEHEKEVKLKEKRTLETTLAFVSRNVCEALSRVAKLKEEWLEVTARTDALNAELSIEQARQCALAGLLDASEKELLQIKSESEQGASKVWKLRNLLCNEVQKVSDQCDVWALFTKPKYIDSAIIPFKRSRNESAKQVFQQDGILEGVQRKRQSLLKERDRLLNEPDSGEEFIRIKNALRYSVEMTANMRV